MTIRVAAQSPESVSESLATVDVVIPVYGERAEALDATLRACVQQIQPIEKIVVVDDGSPRPVSLPDWAEQFPQMRLIRLPENQGQGVARNARNLSSFISGFYQRGNSS